MRSLALDAALATRMALVGLTRWRAFRADLRRPGAAQARTLAAIIEVARHTRFGQDHGFARIDGPADYARAVPVQDYETLRPYIDEQERTGARELCAQAPVLYTRTSGTTGAPKLIPQVPETLAYFARDQAIQAFRQYVHDRCAFSGRLFFVASPAIEGRLDSGTAFGSASGHVTASLPRAARARYVLPPPVSEIADYDLRYLVMLRLALGCADLSFMGTANPSTFLKLLDLLDSRRDELIDDLSRGTFHRLDELPALIRAAVAARLPVSPTRAAAVREALHDEFPSMEALWPDLRLVCTWTGGSCAVALRALEPRLGPRIHVAELGYLSSEFRGTVNVDVAANRCVPMVDESYYEFVEVDAHDRGARDFVGLEALEVGARYHVYVTTRSGLFRYFMNDVVEVTGHFERTPTLTFVRKGRGVTSITGEKLTENQVIEAVGRALVAGGLVAPFFVLLADAGAARYRLLIELDGASADASVEPGALAARVEAELAALNIEYRDKRESGRLGRIEPVMLRPGTADVYKQACLAGGQRESQFKPRILQPLEDWEFDYEACRVR